MGILLDGQILKFPTLTSFLLYNKPSGDRLGKSDSFMKTIGLKTEGRPRGFHHLRHHTYKLYACSSFPRNGVTKSRYHAPEGDYLSSVSPRDFSWCILFSGLGGKR